MNKPKVGEIWKIQRARWIFKNTKKGDIIYENGMKIKVLKVKFWSSDMDFHNLIILTLKRLPDKTWVEIIKEKLCRLWKQKK